MTNPGAIEVTGEELQQKERGGIRDMHVVENGDHRGLDGRARGTSRDDGVEEAEARGVRCEKRFGTGTTSERRNDLSQVVDGGTERIAKRRDPDPLDEDTEDFSPRPVGRSAPRLPAPTPRDLGARCVCSGCQLRPRAATSPMPGSPATRKSLPRPDLASSRPASSAALSASRPTNRSGFMRHRTGRGRCGLPRWRSLFAT